MKYKLIAIDLDGTLLKRHRKITKKNFQALKNFTDAGGQIVISTGRAITSARKIANKIEKYTGKKMPYIISLCGSVIYDDKDKIISQKLISPNITKKIAAEVKRLGLNIWIYPKEIETEGVYSKSLVLAFIAKITKNINLKKIDFDKTFMFARKINVFSLNAKKQKEFEKIIKSKLSKYVQIQKTNNMFMEISPIGSSKGDAIKIIAKRLNIPLNEVAAAGDSGNDISAAIVSKCFCAIGNNKSLKSYSSEEYSRWKSAVAEFINNRLLGEPAKVKIIACDLDGTVLEDEKWIGADFNKKITPLMIHNNIQSLVVASGRSIGEIHKIIKQNNLTAPIRYVISNNGAIVYDLYKQKTIYLQPLLKDVAYKLFEFFKGICKSKKYGNVTCFFHIHNDDQIKKAINDNESAIKICSSKEKIACKNSKDTAFYDLCNFERLDPIYRTKSRGNLSVTKFVILFKNQKYRDMCIKDLKKLDLDVMITASSTTNIEINANYVSKGNALKQLAKILKIKNSEFMAIGDQTNDITMLKLTDSSFAFNDSPIEVRNAAKYILEKDDKENAIIKALKIYNKERK